MAEAERKKFLSEGVDKDGNTVSWESTAYSEKEARESIEAKGGKINKIVPASGRHLCKYCGTITVGKNKMLLCEECQTTFGHNYYFEL